jgi:hypothetical protein
MDLEEKKDKHIVAQVGSYNNDPNIKNYSNCDISGSFYTVTAFDLSTNEVVKKEVAVAIANKVVVDVSGNKIK